MSKFIVSKAAKKLVAYHLKHAKESKSTHFESMQALSDLEYYASSFDVYRDADARYFSDAWGIVSRMKFPKRDF